MGPRYLRGYGLLEAPVAHCVERLAADPLLTARPAVVRDDAIAYLSELTSPATRHALFAVNDRWTAVVNNFRYGSDFADRSSWFSRACGARACRVVDTEAPSPVRIFQLVGPDGGRLRSVHLMLDGERWDFGTSGDPLPAETDLRYEAGREGERFTWWHVATLLASLGVEPPVPEAFAAAEAFFLLDERLDPEAWAAEVRRNS